MIQDNDTPKPPDEGVTDETQQEEPHCQDCKTWQLMIANQQIGMAMGACVNSEHRDAPFGIVTAHFAACPGFMKKEKQSLIAVPNSVAKRMNTSLNQG